MAKANLEKYELFYLELPQTDYLLTDIEIQDEYDDSPNEPGLSDEQVSRIAQDSLEAVEQDESPDNHDSNTSTSN